MPSAADTTLNDDQTSTWRAPTTGGPRILRRILSLDDFEAPARRYIPRPVFGYVVSGADTNASIRANRAAYDELAFLPKVLVGTAQRTQKTTLFGRTYDAPFGFSPMGGVSLAAYQGDLVLARAAAQANIPMILSGAALTTLEAVREAGSTAWFQAYLPGETEPIRQLIDRVTRAGYDTLVVTVDVPVASNLEIGVRSGTDVLKALGLGAKFVFVGRPVLYAAAIAGAAGVQHAIKLLRDEIHRDMALLGINTLDEMTQERLMEVRGYNGAPLQSRNSGAE